MKLYIMTDLEGVAGVVDFEDTKPTGKYYEKAKELLTEEVNAAVEGATQAGVKDVLVVDGHGPGGIVPEKIHQRAKLLHGRPIPKLWYKEKGCDLAFLLAHHSMNGTENGNLNHSYSSAEVVNMYLNGQKIGEIGMEIYSFGEFNIPVVFVSGDETACLEAEKYVPGIEKAIVKWGINRTCAISLSPIEARRLIKEKAMSAVEKKNTIKPVKFVGEAEFVVEFISSTTAYTYLKRPFVEKIDATTIRIKGSSFLDMWEKFFY